MNHSKYKLPKNKETEAIFLSWMLSRMPVATNCTQKLKNCGLELVVLFLE